MKAGPHWALATFHRCPKPNRAGATDDNKIVGSLALDIAKKEEGYMPPADEVRFTQIAGVENVLFGLTDDGRVWALDPKEKVWRPVPMRIKP